MEQGQRLIDVYKFMHRFSVNERLKVNAGTC